MAALDLDGESEEMKASFQQCKHIDRGEGLKRVVINPVVTGVSVFLIWVFVILCAVEPDHMLHAMNMASFEWIPEVWTWIYIASQDIWIGVLIYVMVVSKYGNLKLGKDDEKPEYTFATWFSMLFSAGVAVGLFYYSVAEPLWHYKGWGGARFTVDQRGYGNLNEDATHAIMITWFHWGLHGWIPYTTMGAVLAIMSYRRGFPMTVRYCFWPLIGEKCYGWIGDCIDILSIITTIFGVCTSLGLGAMQINQGVQRINHGFFRGVSYNVPEGAVYASPKCDGTGQVCGEGQESYGVQVNVGTQIIIIVLVTLVATVSVISGMKRGIVNLSRFNFALGMGLLLTVLFLGETYFCLDVVVQSFGYYIWYLFRVSFQTDAWERLGSAAMGLGGAPDDKGGSNTWLTAWTLFYWGWWISWGPFVGTFLAKISRGRTLREFILGTLIIPTLYSFVWFGIFGAEGIRMQRIADSSGLCTQATSGGSAYAAMYSDSDKENLGLGWTASCVLDPNYHGGYGRCNQFEWTHYRQVGAECVKSTQWVSEPCGDYDPCVAEDPTSPWNQCATSLTPFNLTNAACEGVVTPSELASMYGVFSSNRKSCWVPVQDSAVCLYNQGTNDIFFDQISSYGPRGFSDLLAVVSLVALILYFVTSSDSGSYVVDMISANGHPDPPIAQRIFWSITEGATACALLAAGRNLPNSDGSLKALQAASIFTGLPYTFVLFWCSHSLVLLVREEAGVISKDRKGFNIFIMSLARWKSAALAVVAPGVGMGRVIRDVGGWPLHRFNPQVAMFFWGGLFQALYTAAIIFVFCGLALYQWCIVGLVFYLTFGALLGFLRSSVRTMYGIVHGDLITDQICAICLPMFTLAQIEEQVEKDQPSNKQGEMQKEVAM